MGSPPKGGVRGEGKREKIKELKALEGRRVGEEDVGHEGEGNKTW